LLLTLLSILLMFLTIGRFRCLCFVGHYSSSPCCLPRLNHWSVTDVVFCCRLKTRYAEQLETNLSRLQNSWSPEEKVDKRQSDKMQQLWEEGDDDDDDEEIHVRKKEQLVERWSDEKQQEMLKKFQEYLATVHQEHEQELAQLNNDLTQVFLLSCVLCHLLIFSSLLA